MILPIQHSNLDARKVYSKKDANGFLDTSCMDSDMLHITKWIYHVDQDALLIKLNIVHQTPHVTHKLAHNINENKHVAYKIAVICGCTEIFGCNMNEYQHMT